MIRFLTKKGNKRFVSLKWQTLVLVSVVLISINLSMLLIGYKHLQNFFEIQLSNAIQQNFSALLHQSKDKLLQLTSALTLSANKGNEEGLKESILVDFMNNNWEELHFDRGLESISLHDEKGKSIYHWGEFVENSSLKQMIVSVLSNLKPQTVVSCYATCRIYAAQPIFLADGSTNVLVLESTLIDFIVQFNKDHDIDIALLRSSRPALQGEASKIWNYFLVGSTNKASYQKQLLTLSKNVPLHTLLQRGTSLNIDDKTMYFYTRPIGKGGHNNKDFMVLMTNITERRNDIVNTLLIVVGIFCIGLLITLLALFLLLRRPIQRIVMQADLLPLLATSGFQNVRDEIEKHQRSGNYYNELDVLEDTSIFLSHQLEEMEKEIGNRTNELEHMALYDPLTGLANRRLFSQEVSDILTDRKNNNGMFAVVFIDLDDFKRINDSMGHDAGDELLIKVGQLLTESVWPTDTVARLGGDEFTILLREVGSTDNVIKIMDKILSSFQQNITVAFSKTIKVTLSVGIAIGPKHAQDVSNLMLCADMAMYSAKHDGKNCYRFFSQDMRENIKNSLLLEKEIVTAINESQFRFYYQPIIDLETGQVVMLEALLRWFHPKKGLLAPFEFIDMLEESGKIVELGPQLFEMSCLALKLLESCGLDHISIAINISAKQFKDPELINKLLSVVTKNRIEPSKLELEITESTLMENLDQQCALLNKLQSLGFTSAIDDFGTGYSSLSYLKELPVNVLKIDRSFIKGIPHDEQDVAITSAIAAMAHKLNLQIVAEGIETSEQQNYLQDLDCKYGQGYLYKKPKALETLISYLQDNKDNPTNTLSEYSKNQ